MALATKLNLKHWLCRTHGKSVTAGADNLGFRILRMNLVPHLSSGAIDARLSSGFSRRLEFDKAVGEGEEGVITP